MCYIIFVVVNDTLNIYKSNTSPFKTEKNLTLASKFSHVILSHCNAKFGK